jgi:lipoprotein NlpI
MKKFLISTIAITMLAVSAVADAKPKRTMSHYQFMVETQQMITKQKAMLSRYEKLLQRMMQEESNDSSGSR